MAERVGLIVLQEVKKKGERVFFFFFCIATSNLFPEIAGFTVSETAFTTSQSTKKSFSACAASIYKIALQTTFA